MSGAIVDLNKVRQMRRDEELRQRYAVATDQTAMPIGLLSERLLDRIRLDMAARRNHEAAR